MSQINRAFARVLTGFYKMVSIQRVCGEYWIPWDLRIDILLAVESVV